MVTRVPPATGPYHGHTVTDVGLEATANMSEQRRKNGRILTSNEHDRTFSVPNYGAKFPHLNSAESGHQNWIRIGTVEEVTDRCARRRWFYDLLHAMLVCCSNGQINILRHWAVNTRQEQPDVVNKPVGDWISVPSPNFIAMATTVSPKTFCMVPLSRPSPKTLW